MSIVFDCPSCRARLSTQSIGKQPVHCPKCKSLITLEIQAAIPVEQPIIAPAPSISPTPQSAGIDLSRISKPALVKPKPQVPVQDILQKSVGTANNSTAVNSASPAQDLNAIIFAKADIRDLQNVAPSSGQRNEINPDDLPQRPAHSATPLIESAAPSSPAPGFSPKGSTFTEATFSAVVPFEGQIQSDEQSVNLTNSPKSIHVAILKHKKRQSLLFFVTNSILAMLILLFGGLLYWKVSVPTAAPNENVSPKTNEDAVEKQRNQDAEAANFVDRENPIPAESPQTIEPPEQPDFRFFSKKQLDEIWRLTKPNLVELNIEGPYGKQKAVGLIVDSRGWIVTSYQAVKDATRIEVTAAIEPLNQKNVDAPLVDLVRGRVIDDPKNDLAILAINRRFVVSLADAAISAQDRLVPAIRLLAAAPPSSTNHWGICEANIAQRSVVDQLPLAAKSRIESIDIGHAELSWLTIEGDFEWLPGTPLLDQSGKVQAMISFSPTNSDPSPNPKQRRALAVPMATLSALTKKATGEVKPLGSNLVQTADGKSGLLPDNHPTKKLMVEISISAMECREFGWLPETDEQYRQLTDFAKSLVAGKDFLLSNEPDYQTPAAEVVAFEQVQKRVQEVTEEVSSRIQEVLDEDQAQPEPLNRFAEQKVKSDEDGMVVLYGRVFESGLQLQQFIVKIEGLDTYCAIPFDPAARPLRPGTCWWMVVETKNSEPTIYKIDENRSIQAYPVFQRIEIGPLKPSQ